ncbi:MAG: oligosaccharide flippase family protein, partial [Lachnospiraceae bacterium]|nr:oligosaccharide flippase family protein [Lachnospiraceae bacterium]
MRSENKKEKQEGSAFGGFLRYLYGNIIVLLLGFVSIPLITRVMSNEQYGRTGMFTSAVTVIYIFAILGMDQAYIRYYYTKGIDRRELLARCLFPALGIVILLCVIYCAFSVPANDFLFGEQGRDLTGLVIAYTIISVFERFLFLDIRMSQNGRLYSNLNITSKVIYIILIV